MRSEAYLLDEICKIVSLDFIEETVTHSIDLQEMETGSHGGRVFNGMSTIRNICRGHFDKGDTDMFIAIQLLGDIRICSVNLNAPD